MSEVVEAVVEGARAQTRVLTGIVLVALRYLPWNKGTHRDSTGTSQVPSVVPGCSYRDSIVVPITFLSQLKN